MCNIIQIKISVPVEVEGTGLHLGFKRGDIIVDQFTGPTCTSDVFDNQLVIFRTGPTNPELIAEVEQAVRSNDEVVGCVQMDKIGTESRTVITFDSGTGIAADDILADAPNRVGITGEINGATGIAGNRTRAFDTGIARSAAVTGGFADRLQTRALVSQAAVIVCIDKFGVQRVLSGNGYNSAIGSELANQMITGVGDIKIAFVVASDVRGLVELGAQSLAVAVIALTSRASYRRDYAGGGIDPHDSMLIGLDQIKISAFGIEDHPAAAVQIFGSLPVKSVLELAIADVGVSDNFGADITQNLIRFVHEPNI